MRGIDADQFAGGEERDAFAEQKGFAQIVGDEGDGFAEARGQRAKLALQFGAGDGIECAKRLVHKQDGGIAGEGARDADALALASRELAGVAGGEFAGVEADQEEHLADAVADALLGPALEAGDQRDVALDGPVGEQADVLNDVTDGAAEADGIPGGLIAAVNENLAGGGREQEVDELERSGFAGTAAAEEDQGLAPGDGEVEFVEQEAAVGEAISNVAHFDGEGVCGFGGVGFPGIERLLHGACSDQPLPALIAWERAAFANLNKKLG